MHDDANTEGGFGRWRQRARRWAQALLKRWHGRSSEVPAPLQSTPVSSAPLVGPFTEARFGPQGSRRYMLYEPASRSRGRSPLVVMLHGCQQSARDFAAATRMNAVAEELGVFVLYPEQALSANAMRCWNWYALQDRSQGDGDAALIAALTRHVVLAHDLDAARVYVAGLSAGGGMAAVLARDYPRLFAALGVHSGPPAGLAHDLASAMRLMSRGPDPAAALSARALQAREGERAAAPTIVFHGDEDGTVHPSNGEALHDAAGVPGASGAGDNLIEQVPAQGVQHAVTRTVERAAGSDLTRREWWLVHGAGHAWCGGDGHLAHTDPQGPDASREMLRFFLQHHLAALPAGG